MGSISDTIQCPQCSSEASIELYYKTSEEIIVCDKCGYMRKFLIKNYEDKDTVDPIHGFGWIPDYSIEEIFGLGAYKLRGKTARVYECGSFTDKLSEEMFVQLVNDRHDELAHAEYTLYSDGVLQTKKILIQGDTELQEAELGIEPTPFVDGELPDYLFATPEELEKDFKNTTNT